MADLGQEFESHFGANPAPGIGARRSIMQNGLTPAVRCGHHQGLLWAGSGLGNY